MKSAGTVRRSKRVVAKQNLLMTILGPKGNELVKEVVTTVEISRHGARIQGLHPLKPGWCGVLVELKSLRKAPFRVAWQTKPPTGKDYLDSGVEFTAEFDFWGQAFPSPNASAAKPATAAKDELSLKELLQEVLKSPAFQKPESGRFLQEIWCGLVEQLEERKAFTRDELVAYLQKIG